MVAEVWFRRGCPPRYYGLVVSSLRAPAVQRTDTHQMKTNKARTCLFGRYPRIVKPSSWTLLCEGPSRTFVDESNEGIGALAFEGDRPTTMGKIISMPRSSHVREGVKQTEDFFFSEANLDSLSEVVPCLIGTKITGMLLGYADGHQEAVGQARLDCLSAPLTICPGTL